jgi:hypothetical protein
MQLSARLGFEPVSETATEADTPQSETMREYEARRCHVCGCKYPSFGFGPPLQTSGRVIWSCGAHHAEVDRIVSGATTLPAAEQQARLL